MLYHGNVTNVLGTLPARSVQCVITSPPYWGLRDYQVEGQLGAEPSPDCGTHGKSQCGKCFVCSMVAVFRAVDKVLRNDGTLWLNLGDTYGPSENRNGMSGSTVTGSKEYGRGCKDERETRDIATGLAPGNLIGVPWRVALALQANGWILRAAMPWVKRNAMPESCSNRPSKAVEDVFLFTKGDNYYFDMDAIAKPATPGTYVTNEKKAGSFGQAIASGRKPSGNAIPGTVWTTGDTRNFRTSDLWFSSTGVVGVNDQIAGFDVPVANYKGAHFATFPPRLITPMILAGSREGDTVLDPFVGSGTTPATAISLGRKAIGIDLNAKYLRENAIPRIEAAKPPEPKRERVIAVESPDTDVTI